MQNTARDNGFFLSARVPMPTVSSKKAIVHARVSSEDQVDGSGIDRHIKLAKQHAQAYGLQIVETLSDEGQSAHSGAHIGEGHFGKSLAAAGAGK